MVYSLLLGQCTEVLVDKIKQDNNWVAISTLCDPNLLFKLIERSALKQSGNHNKTGVLIAEQKSTIQLCQEYQVSKTAHYDQSTTRVEVACQSGVCHYSLHFYKTRLRSQGREITKVYL